MSDLIHELYEKRIYPPMSHPVSDPAVSAVAAKLAGLEVPHPRRARILEIGCCSGHNLIPLARRWPDSHCTGIDLSESSIAEARRRADLAAVPNVEFHAVDLRDYQPVDGPFDYIIAHGFFSWVPDEVKEALLSFCRRQLSPSGIATVSFNLECGWKPRLPVIAKVRAIQQAGGGDEMFSLGILRSIMVPGHPEIAIVDDMLAKGPAILACDDFGPVNHPWPLDQFVRTAASAGLRWLGESDPGENLPARPLPDIPPLDSLEFQMAMDEASGRTFRSAVLCREDAPLSEMMSLECLFDLSLRNGQELPENEVERRIHAHAPECLPLGEVLDCRDGPGLRLVIEGITRRRIRPRIEPVRFRPHPPTHPQLDAFRMLSARERLPVVDIWHQPCTFPVNHYQILAAMDGSLDKAELAGFSRRQCPELDFEPWLQHLSWRGFFV